MPCLVQVFWRAHARPSGVGGHFSILEMDAEDFEQACRIINSPGLIGANDLWTRPSPSNRALREVNERRPIAFRGSAVERVCLPHWRFVEAE